MYCNTTVAKHGESHPTTHPVQIGSPITNSRDNTWTRRLTQPHLHTTFWGHPRSPLTPSYHYVLGLRPHCTPFSDDICVGCRPLQNIGSYVPHTHARRTSWHSLGSLAQSINLLRRKIFAMLIRSSAESFIQIKTGNLAQKTNSWR